MNDMWTIFESKSGRYFRMDFDTVMETIDSLNKRIKTNAMKWNDIFRAFRLPELMIGELPFNHARVNSHLDFGIKTDDYAPVVVIDCI